MREKVFRFQLSSKFGPLIRKASRVRREGFSRIEERGGAELHLAGFLRGDFGEV